jgi:hypothetical protein
MTKKNMRAVRIITICAFLLVAAALVLNRYYIQPTQVASKMMAVRMIVARAMSVYFEQHHVFPSALSELPSHTLTWGEEGSSASDLAKWHYRSSGQSFMMTWTNSRGFEAFLSGSNGQLFYSREDGAVRVNP